MVIVIVIVNRAKDKVKRRSKEGKKAALFNNFGEFFENIYSQIRRFYIITLEAKVEILQS